MTLWRTIETALYGSDPARAATPPDDVARAVVRELRDLRWERDEARTQRDDAIVEGLIAQRALEEERDAALARADHAQEQADRLREQCEEARIRAEAAEAELAASIRLAEWERRHLLHRWGRTNHGPRPDWWTAYSGRERHDAPTLRRLAEMLGLGGEP